MKRKSQTGFEQLVRQAIQNLPKHIVEKLENVAVCVEKYPSREQLRRTGMRRGDLLLGLYAGVPQTAWGKGFGGHLPDKITIFQDSIQQCAASHEKIEELVRETVWHEIAHHFGLDEKEIESLEKKKSP